MNRIIQDKKIVLIGKQTQLLNAKNANEKQNLTNQIYRLEQEIASLESQLLLQKAPLPPRERIHASSLESRLANVRQKHITNRLETDRLTAGLEELRSSIQQPPVKQNNVQINKEELQKLLDNISEEDFAGGSTRSMRRRSRRRKTQKRKINRRK